MLLHARYRLSMKCGKLALTLTTPAVRDHTETGLCKLIVYIYYLYDSVCIIYNYLYLFIYNIYLVVSVQTLLRKIVVAS